MEVLGFSLFNSYAEYIVVSADQIVTKPPYMPWDIAGGLSGNGQGAHMALKAIGIGHGDTVIIHGAAGGFGTWACQLAKRWGPRSSSVRLAKQTMTICVHSASSPSITGKDL